MEGDALRGTIDVYSLHVAMALDNSLTTQIHHRTQTIQIIIGVTGDEDANISKETHDLFDIPIYTNISCRFHSKKPFFLLKNQQVEDA